MGIQGLLPLLKDAQKPIHVSQLKGQTVGIDGYVWLHRGAYGCAKALVKGESTTKYINYAIHRIRMLQHHGIKPYVVFDGDRLPSKAGTEEDREQRRTLNRAKAEELSMQGKETAAFEFYAKCVDITPEMAYQLIKALKVQGVDYVVAPYEADAQLAYLERNGIIDAVVTEDSDLLVFGCKRVLFKMDGKGDCIEISWDRLTACKTLSFVGWTTDLFRQMAILSGCDYLPSIAGMGLKNAHRLLTRYKSVKKVLQVVRLEGKMRVPPDYAQQFEQAEKTFLHQRVWDPREERLTTLQPIGEDEDEAVTHYVGPDIQHDIAAAIARGDVDPITRQPIKDLVPSARYSQQQQKTGGPSSKGRSSAAPSVKGQPGLQQFFKKAAPGARASSSGARVLQALAGPSSSRQPLAAKDVNKATPATVTPMKKSKYFGGSSKGVGSPPAAPKPPAQPRQVDGQVPAVPATGVAAIEEGHVDDDTAPLLQHPNSQSSPIAGIGDFFCELDGADEDVLFNDDEEEEVRAEAVMHVAATFSEDVMEDGEETSRWAAHANGEVQSDLSDADSTPRKTKKSGHHPSSPLDFDDHTEDDAERNERSIPAAHAAPFSSPDDIHSSPSRAAAAAASPSRSQRRRSSSPTSPMAAAASRRKAANQPQQSARKSLSFVREAPVEPAAEDDCNDKSDEDDDLPPAIADLTQALWAKYAHRDAAQPAQTPAASKTPKPNSKGSASMRPRLGRALTATAAGNTGSSATSSCRPLRLFHSDQPPALQPFIPTAIKDASAAASTPVAQGRRGAAAALKFNTEPRSNSDGAQPPAGAATPTPLMRSSHSAPNVLASASAKRKASTKTLGVTNTPLGAGPNDEGGEAANSGAGPNSITKRRKTTSAGATAGALRFSRSPQPPALPNMRSGSPPASSSSSAFLDGFRFQKGPSRGTARG